MGEAVAVARAHDPTGAGEASERLAESLVTDSAGLAKHVAAHRAVRTGEDGLDLGIDAVGVGRRLRKCRRARVVHDLEGEPYQAFL